VHNKEITSHILCQLVKEINIENIEVK